MRKGLTIFAYFETLGNHASTGMDGLTWIFSASPNCGRFAQDEYDENKAIRVALIQSTRPSSSMTKIPRKVKLDNKYKGLPHVGLQCSSQNLTWLYVCGFTHLANCLRLLITVLKAVPIEAPAEKGCEGNGTRLLRVSLTGILTREPRASARRTDVSLCPIFAIRHRPLNTKSFCLSISLSLHLFRVFIQFPVDHRQSA